MDYAVWNALHDGGIESVHGKIPGDVSVTIDIGYLCGKLPTSAKQLVVHLLQCSRFEFQPFEGDRVVDLEAMGARDIEILSADLEDNLVTVCCTDGTLRLAYENVEIRLVEGIVVTQAELEAAADRYWAEWSLKNTPR